MGQVPNNKSKYIIVGKGRLARHFIHYFTLLEIPHIQFTRNSNLSFSDVAANVDKILVLIKDDFIEEFIYSNRNNVSNDKIWIHCSGILSTELAESAHPLASFSDSLFDLEFYKSIPFAIEKGRTSFKKLFPELPNPSFEVDKELKAFYHTMCSITGNFTTILWQNFFKFIEENLHNLPDGSQVEKSFAYPYLKSVMFNLMNSDDPLTGPLKRNDTKTIQKHLEQLHNTPLKDVYESFIKLYDNIKEEK